MAVRIIHIGRKVPKHYRELPGASHMGRGIWILPMEPDTSNPPKCKCGAPCELYGGIGGWSVSSKPCNEKNAARQRAARARSKRA